MSSDSARSWLLLGGESGEANAFEFDASGAGSTFGLEEAGPDWSAIVLGEANMGVGAVEDVLIEDLNATADKQGDPCNTDHRSDSHSADVASSFLATERHEDQDSVHSAAGANTMRESLPQAPDMLPRSIRRKNVRRSSGTSRKNSASHGPALFPLPNGRGTMPLPFPPAGASALQIPIMTASLAIARETHWAHSQLALQYAARAQLYENSLRNYAHMSRGPAALQGSQTLMAMFEPYRHCFFSPLYHVHHQPQTQEQRKAEYTATTITTSPRHPVQGKQAEADGGGCSGPGEEGSGVRGKRRQLFASSSAKNVHASTNAQHIVIAQVKAFARKYEHCQQLLLHA